jgi:hypothetical protein
MSNDYVNELNSFKSRLARFFEIIPRKTTDVGIDLKFERAATPHVERITGTRFEIVMSDEFIWYLMALIYSLLVESSELSEEYVDMTFEPSASLEGSRGMVRECLRGKEGVKRLWERPVDAAQEMSAYLYNTLSSASKLRARIAQHALLAACYFLTLHEASHVYGGHLAYRDKIMGSLKRFDDKEILDELREGLCALEILCDFSTLLPLYGVMAAHIHNFKGAAKRRGLSEPDDFSALYCCGFSLGFGVAAVFLLTDAFFLASPEDYHPKSVERMTLISGESISKCLTILRPADDGSARELIGYFQHLGKFHGIRKCLEVWDSLGLDRRHDPVLDEFLQSDKPCILCNRASEAVINRYKTVGEKLQGIKSRMDEWHIKDVIRETLLGNGLNGLVARHSELVQSRAEHIAAQTRRTAEERL